MHLPLAPNMMQLPSRQKIVGFLHKCKVPLVGFCVVEIKWMGSDIAEESKTIDKLKRDIHKVMPFCASLPSPNPLCNL
jgi:hypothetical protein